MSDYNYNLTGAIDLFNRDQVRIQTMYYVEFHSGINSIDDTLKRLQVYAQGFNLPERTLNTEDLQYRAYKIPVITTIDMGQDHDITVYADVRGDLRRALLDWQAASLDPDIREGSYFEANRRPTKLGPDEGKEPNIIVNLLAPDMQTVVERTCIYGARCVKVGGLDMSNTASGISTFTATFKSVYWTQEGLENSNLNSDVNRHTNLGKPDQFPNEGRATNDPMDAVNLSY